MLFNSIDFLVFMTVTYGLYLVLKHRAQNVLLLVASYYFYAAWDFRFLGLILVSTAVSYVTAIKMEDAKDERSKRFYVIAAAVFGLGLLGVFKYFNFFAESLVGLLAVAGIHARWTDLHLILPVGISFYTFQALGYSIDVYRGEVKASRKPIDFGIFVAFFPLLLAGPIERAKRLLPQIERPRTVTLEHVTNGAALILFGLFKKAVIADGLSTLIDPVFDADSGYSGLDILIAAYAYVLQMYCDFSGYTDIARGVAGVMGISLMENFRTPFYAKSPSEYWTRWHISLSSWVKDYVYLPLALHYMRLERGIGNEYKPHLYAMALMGLWHGAAWTYILWGVYHGTMLVLWDVIKWPKRLKGVRKRVPPAFWIVVYFHITLGSLFIFRAKSVKQVGDYLGTVFLHFGGLPLHIARPSLPTLVGIPMFLVLDYLAYRAQSERFFGAWQPAARGALYASLFVLLLMGWSNAAAEFIYLKF